MHFDAVPSDDDIPNQGDHVSNMPTLSDQPVHWTTDQKRRPDQFIIFGYEPMIITYQTHSPEDD